MDAKVVDQENNGTKTLPYKMTYGKLMCEQRILHAAITAAMMNLVYCCLEPILSLRLPDYDLSDRATGLIFGIEPLTYMIGTFLLPFIVPKWVANRVTMITALFSLAFATVLVGPFFEDENLVSMMIGLGMSGFLMGFLCIPNMPEMMQACREAHPQCDLEHANSLMSGMLNAGFGTGQAIGPLVGAFLFELVGFRMTMNITGLLTLAYAVIYLLCARGCQAYSETCENFTNRNHKLSVVEEILKEAVDVRHSSIFKSSIISTYKV